jgi:hypothetical protein
MRRLPGFGLLAAALLIALSSARAHEGEDHSHDAPVVTDRLPAAPRAEAASDAFELVAVAKDGQITFWLDRFATNEPIRDAGLTVETPQGSVEATHAPDGSYRVPAPWSEAPGRYDLIVTVAKGETEILTLTLDVPPPTAAEAPRSAGGAWARGIKDGLVKGETMLIPAVILAAIIGALAGLWLGRRKAIPVILVAGFGLWLAPDSFAHEGESHETPAAAAAPAREIAQALPDGSVFVPKSTQRSLAIRTQRAEAAVHRRTVELPGRIIADPNASGYVQAVVGGRLSAPEGGFPRLGTPVKKGDVLAYVHPPLQAIDVSDMRQRQGELDQQISIVERRLARYETLAPGGAVSRTQLDETRLELQGLRDRRASLDRVRGEPEPLVAPVDGIIADGTPIAGQIAQTNAVVFHIIDPTRLWVEALSYEALPHLQRGTMRVGTRDFALAFRGSGFADRNQSIPIHFAITGDVAGVRVGQFVTVLAETPEEQRGLAVPRASVVRNSAGQDLVYDHVAAERFARRPVRIEPLDGQRVLISEGLAAGARIVVQGAELIDHIR